MEMPLLNDIQAQTGWEKRTNFGIPDHYCICCGRKVNQNKVFWVVMNHERGTIHRKEDVDENDERFSLYEVGADCANKYLKGIAFKY